VAAILKFGSIQINTIEKLDLGNTGMLCLGDLELKKR